MMDKSSDWCMHRRIDISIDRQIVSTIISRLWSNTSRKKENKDQSLFYRSSPMLFLLRWFFRTWHPPQLTHQRHNRSTQLHTTSLLALLSLLQLCRSKRSCCPRSLPRPWPSQGAACSPCTSACLYAVTHLLPCHVVPTLSSFRIYLARPPLQLKHVGGCMIVPVPPPPVAIPVPRLLVQPVYLLAEADRLSAVPFCVVEAVVVGALSVGWVPSPLTPDDGVMNSVAPARRLRRCRSAHRGARFEAGEEDARKRERTRVSKTKSRPLPKIVVPSRCNGVEGGRRFVGGFRAPLGDVRIEPRSGLFRIMVVVPSLVLLIPMHVRSGWSGQRSPPACRGRGLTPHDSTKKPYSTSEKLSFGHGCVSKYLKFVVIPLKGPK